MDTKTHSGVLETGHGGVWMVLVSLSGQLGLNVDLITYNLSPSLSPL